MDATRQYLELVGPETSVAVAARDWPVVLRAMRAAADDAATLAQTRANRSAGWILRAACLALAPADVCLLAVELGAPPTDSPLHVAFHTEFLRRLLETGAVNAADDEVLMDVPGGGGAGTWLRAAFVVGYMCEGSEWADRPSHDASDAVDRAVEAVVALLDAGASAPPTWGRSSSPLHDFLRALFRVETPERRASACAAGRAPGLLRRMCAGADLQFERADGATFVYNSWMPGAERPDSYDRGRNALRVDGGATAWDLAVALRLPDWALAALRPPGARHRPETVTYWCRPLEPAPAGAEWRRVRSEDDPPPVVMGAAVLAELNGPPLAPFGPLEFGGRRRRPAAAEPAVPAAALQLVHAFLEGPPAAKRARA